MNKAVNSRHVMGAIAFLWLLLIPTRWSIVGGILLVVVLGLSIKHANIIREQPANTQDVARHVHTDAFAALLSLGVMVVIAGQGLAYFWPNDHFVAQAWLAYAALVALYIFMAARKTLPFGQGASVLSLMMISWVATYSNRGAGTLGAVEALLAILLGGWAIWANWQLHKQLQTPDPTP